MVALIKALAWFGLALSVLTFAFLLATNEPIETHQPLPERERRTSDDFQLYSAPKTVELQFSLNGYAPDVVYLINDNKIHPLLECYNLFNCTHVIGDTNMQTTWVIKHTGMNCETSYTSINPQNINEPIKLIRGDCND